MAKRNRHPSASPRRAASHTSSACPQAELGVAELKGSHYSFRWASPRVSSRVRMQPGLQAWPATGGAVVAPLQIARALFQKPVAGIRVPGSPTFTETSVDSQLTEAVAYRGEPPGSTSLPSDLRS